MIDEKLILLVRDATPAMQLTEALPEIVPMEMAAVIKGEPGPPGTQYNLETWGAGLLFKSVVITERDVNGFTKKADVLWPDGTPGKFVVDALSVTFPGAIDAWHATYLQPSPKVVTQPAVTRNSEGYVDIQPSIVITEA